jgi:hypothetical protein
MMRFFHSFLHSSMHNYEPCNDDEYYDSIDSDNQIYEGK